ncbi:rhodanese-like domain-containing protein [Patescibacteria group bacterium]|nr:rhodanese-like domain-containing protein [Patescibacteria group bacterium]
MRIQKQLAVVLLLISLLFSLQGCSSNSSSPEITASDVHKKIAANENIVLIDVRTQEEHLVDHISNDISIPLDTLNDIVNKSEIRTGDEIIVYCRSGRRSLEAQLILESLGYKNVKSMTGGITNWTSLNYVVCNGNTRTC